jgi:hypothetical protein
MGIQVTSLPCHDIKQEKKMQIPPLKKFERDSEASVDGMQFNSFQAIF